MSRCGRGGEADDDRACTACEAPCPDDEEGRSPVEAILAEIGLLLASGLIRAPDGERVLFLGCGTPVMVFAEPQWIAPARMGPTLMSAIRIGPAQDPGGG